jgi:alpha-ketoglutaric semialdehyde dehydrogenase
MISDSLVAQIDCVMHQAEKAGKAYKKMPATKRADFLENIATLLSDAETGLIALAAEETHLEGPRLKIELIRTINQLKQFAGCVREGSWVEASIDTAQPDRMPLAKPDIRKMLIPLGPVIVFGASNFPFAYSTAGGDTASALTVGCPVVVKAHPGHPKTSKAVAELIEKAAQNTQMPEHVFQHVEDSSLLTGQTLVLHKYTAAVGFTGSVTGGRALFDLAASRSNPIPVFAEMGSANPVCILPDALRQNAAGLAKQYAASISNSMGQFCTKPGLQLVPESGDLPMYIRLLASALEQIKPQEMLHPGIATGFYKRLEESLAQKGVTQETHNSKVGQSNSGVPTLATVSASDFIQNRVLHTEVFGPYSLLIKCRDQADMLHVAKTLEGQLTATIIGTRKDLIENQELIDILTEKAGRIILNGVPTGVEVCPSMVHGGPYPATSDARFTAVGSSAMKRFARPVCFQNFPTDLLPDELKDNNPLSIMRVWNGSWRR